MSPREQLLQKRVAYLEARSNALMMVLDRAIDDIERAESVACAFAWDLSNNIDAQRAAADNLYSDPAYNAAVGTADGIEEDVLSMWDAATVFVVRK